MTQVQDSSSQFNIFDEIDDQNQENEDDTQIELEKFKEAVVWGTDWTTETIVRQMEKKNIQLDPQFQRREAWNDKKKSQFIESLILGLPIPPIILAEHQEKRNRYLVIDGKQRLITLRKFFSKPEDSEFPPLKLRGLESLSMLNSKSFYELSEDIDFKDYVAALENQSIRTIVIRNWPDDDFLHTVFLRLNTGSLRLSPQELRRALRPGKFLNFVDDFSVDSKVIRKVLNISKPDARMRDVELLVRFYAFKYFIEDYSGNLKKFFDYTVDSLNKSWEQGSSAEIERSAKNLEEAIKHTYKIFKKDAFRKWKNNEYETRFNRAIFDIMTYYFSEDSIRTSSLKYQEQIKNCFQDLCSQNTDFLTSFEVSTKNIQPTRIRFQVWGNALQEILDCSVSVPNIGSHS